MSSRAHVLIVGAIAVILLGAALAGTTYGLRGYFADNQPSASPSGAAQQSYNQSPVTVPLTAPATEVGAISSEPPEPQPLTPTQPPSLNTDIKPSGCVYVHGNAACGRDCEGRFQTDTLCNPCLDSHNLSEMVCYVPY